MSNNKKEERQFYTLERTKGYVDMSAKDGQLLYSGTG
jgi:hypothetical protein